jgi:hypothetical protein
VITLADRFVLDRASERQRGIKSACDLAGRQDLAPSFVSSDRSVSQVLAELLRLRAFDQIVLSGPGAVVPN